MVDTRIILGYDPGNEDVYTGMARAQSLRDAARSSQMQEMQFQQQQEDRTLAQTRRQQFGQTLGGMVPPELAEFAKADPEGAMKLWEFKKSATAEQKAAAMEAQTVLANTASTLRNVPYEQRRQALAQMAPQLSQMGVSPEQLQGFDPTDGAIDAIIGQTLGVKGVLEFEDKAEGRRLTARGQDITMNGQNVTMRGQDMAASSAAQGRAVTMRGQNISAANSRRSASGGVNGAKPVKVTEGQAKDGFNAKRMVGANAVLDGFENTPGFKPGIAGVASLFGGSRARQYESAKEEWADSLIRLTTGAAATKDEIASTKTAYFPDPRDDGQTILQKAKMRARVTQDALQRGGPGALPSGPARQAPARTQAAPAFNSRVIEYDANGKRVR